MPPPPLSRPRPPAAAFLAALCLTLAAARPVLGGGFEIPEQGARAVGRGGAFAVGAADLTALSFNPAGLARLRGTRLLYNHNLLFHEIGFRRAPLDARWGAAAGTTFPEVSDTETLFPKNVFVAVSSDFGLDDWTFAAGVYGPSGIGSHSYPDYGPQSFLLSRMDIDVRYYSLAVAWQLPGTVAVGLTLQWVDGNHLEYRLVTDSTSTTTLTPLPDPTSTQLLSTLHLEDRVGATAILGVWWAPLPFLEVGLSGRVIPVPLSLQGGVTVDKPTLVTEDVTARTEVTIPAQVRGGVRYVHRLADGRERFDVELDVVWENWSAVDAFDLDFEGAISGQKVADLRIARAWRDTVSVRLGGDVAVWPGHLTLRAGGFWESAATPTNYTHLDFPSWQRGGVGLGVTGTWAGVSVTVGWLHVFQESRTVSEDFGKVFQQRALQPCPAGCEGASGVVANAGRFRAAFDILALGLDVNVTEWF